MTTAGKTRIAPPDTPRAVLQGAVALALAGSLTACQVLPIGGDDSPPSVGVPAPTADGPGGLDSVGDDYVPGDGNGGYDVQHYKLDLDIRPGGSPELTATADITAKATQPLSRFNLDLVGLTVSEVKVNGQAAQYQHQDSELVISPPQPLAKDASFAVTVRYSGTPKPVSKPPLGIYGWVRTSDGVFVACQPSGAHTWFPANDHPSDKATFEFRVTVPDGLTAIANGEPDTTPTGGAGAPGGEGTGRPESGTPGAPGEEGQSGIEPVSHRLHRAAAPVTWRVKEPMAPYLATVTVGRFEVRTGKTPGGIPVITAVDPSLTTTDLGDFHAKNTRITHEFTELFGPYPFSSTGGLVDNAAVGFALETQTRPVYGSFGASEDIIAHELAHMWFGDSVSVTRWKDIWLNEGFASYAEWLWAEKAHGVNPQQQFDALYNQADNPELWDIPTGNPGRDDMFSAAVYKRGALTLHALRKKIGDEKFFRLLKTWTEEHRHSNATTEQFIETAERVSGQQLDSFFQAWLYQRGRPAR